MSDMDIAERLHLLVPIVTEEQRQSAHEAMREGAREIERLRAELARAPGQSGADLREAADGVVRAADRLLNAKSNSYRENWRDQLTARIAVYCEKRAALSAPEARPTWKDICRESNGPDVCDSADACNRCKEAAARRTSATAPSVAEAAKLLQDATPNPTFDILKPELIGEHSVRLPDFDEDGNEYVRTINVPWDVQKAIIGDAIRALSEAT